MKLRAAYLVPPVVCALPGAAWAAGDGKVCLEGAVKKCVEIGTAVANEEPPVGDVDQLRVDCEKTKDDVSCAGWLREQIKAGCRSGKQAACLMLGKTEARVIADETAPTAEALEASCKKKDQRACVDLATKLMKAEPPRADAKRALALLDKSCKADFADACAKLGLVLVFDGKKSDTKRGERLLKRACDLGSESACNWVPSQPKRLEPGDTSRGPGILGLLKGDDVPFEQSMKNGPARNTRATAARTADRKPPPKGDSAARTSDRGLAYSFRCDHTLDEIWDLLRRNSRLKWRRGDSEDRGVYVRSEVR